VARRNGQLELPLDYRPLVEKYRALCRKYRALVERYGADVADEGGTLALAFAAIRRSHTAMALLCGGTFLVRNARWLALERREGESWCGDGRDYPNLRTLAISEASAMGGKGERTRALRFARQGLSEVIDVRLERLDRPGRTIYLVMVRDVTDEVHARQREERERSEAAEQERLRAVGELASSTAHRINNVLHAMAMRLTALRGQVGTGHEEGLNALARMISDAAACVARLEDLAGRSRTPDQREEAPAAAPGADPTLPRQHVLVVDDDPDVLEAAELALAHLGQDVAVTASGADAIGRLTSGERFDLVLCDIGMPQLDGWEVAREAHALSPDTRLYLISGWAREIREEDVERAGAAGLLAKPLSLETLRGLLAESARRARALAQAPMCPTP